VIEMGKKYRLLKGPDIGINVNRFGRLVPLKGYGKGPHKDATMIGLRSQRTPGSVTGRIGDAGLYRRRKK